MIGFNSTNKNFWFKKTGIYYISVNLDINNNEDIDNGVSVYFKKNGV